MSGNTEYLIYYVYDETGLPIGLKYRTSAYEAGVFDCFFFEKNLQGDIIAVYNSTGKRIGSYTYDAWGNFNYSLASGNTALETRIVFRLNPFRYPSSSSVPRMVANVRHPSCERSPGTFSRSRK